MQWPRLVTYVLNLCALCSFRRALARQEAEHARAEAGYIYIYMYMSIYTYICTNICM